MTNSSKLAILSILFLLLTTSAAFAADDGNTKPRLSSYPVQSGTADIINQTSVSGNIKGVACHFVTGAGANLIFTVNGAATQTIDATVFSVLDADQAGYNTGWIPMNIRFTSSIRVQIQHTGGTGESYCAVSWALD